MKVTSLQLDALKELINIGVGNGANLLNKMLNKPIALNTIEVHILSHKDYESYIDFEENTSIVHMGFDGTFGGRVNLIFPNKDAVRLLELIAPWLNVDASIGKVKKNVLTEVGNIVINGVIGSLSNVLKLQSSYSLPQYYQGHISELLKTEQIGAVILANTQYAIEEESIKGTLLIFLELRSIVELQKHLDKLVNNQSESNL
ncbi:hypothetical protein [Carboxylicivirga sp. RSCT41]|uniref:hypothetical protein n=1 Tax=Carboxylicivirga agarovorans TaxID=3417570 RepID=UPI003D33DDF6